MPTEVYGSDTTPKTGDTQRMLMIKEIWATRNIGSITISGVTGVFASGADPNGAVSADGYAICFGTGAVDGYVWKKVTAGTSMSDWIPF